MLREYDATHEEGQDDFDVCGWCLVNCSAEAYMKVNANRSDPNVLTPTEVNEARQAILQHYFATIVCGHAFRRHISIV
eukprot:12394479-Heterocapsa_arctica.AAC.1